jgi:hypothetical protein
VVIITPSPPLQQPPPPASLEPLGEERISPLASSPPKTPFQPPPADLQPLEEERIRLPATSTTEALRQPLATSLEPLEEEKTSTLAFALQQKAVSLENSRDKVGVEYYVSWARCYGGWRTVFLATFWNQSFGAFLLVFFVSKSLNVKYCNICSLLALYKMIYILCCRKEVTLVYIYCSTVSDIKIKFLNCNEKKIILRHTY